MAGETHNRITVRLEIGKWTDIGNGKEINEDDAIAIHSYLFTGKKKRTKISVLGVADGLGGHEAGEVASEYAFQNIGRILGSRVRSIDAVPTLLERYVLRVNEGLKTLKSGGRFGDMGTTLTLGIVIEDRVAIANVGDSRAYIFRNGTLTRITKDHSMVQELLDLKKITEEQAFTHPNRNVVLQALGQDSEVKPDTYVRRVMAGELLLFSSDGLHDTLRDSEIEEVIRDNLEKHAKVIAKALVEEAVFNDARDNVTCVVGKVI